MKKRGDIENACKSDHLIRHALTVEAVMRYFAELYGEDVEKWGIIGLLHDIDFEKYPEQHCQKVKCCRRTAFGRIYARH